MADQSDVCLALVQAITAILFPSPPTQLSVSSVSGSYARVYAGWPVAASLNADLAAPQSIVNVSVFPTQVVRNVTRYSTDPVILSEPNPTLTAIASGSTVTFGGTGSADQVVAVKIGDESVNVAAYPYRLSGSDTPSTVAAALAALIPNAAASSATLTIPTNMPVSALVVADIIAVQRYRQMVQEFRVTVWANDDAPRNATSSPILARLAATDWIPLADGLMGRLLPVSDYPSDASENSTLYRRDMTFSVEYALTLPLIIPRMTIGIENIHPNAQPSAITFTV